MTKTPRSVKREAHGGVRVEFRRSLLHSILHDLTFISLAEDYEGFDQWVYSARASMARDLLDQIELLATPFANVLTFRALYETPQIIDSMPGVIRWLSEIPDDVVFESNAHSLRKYGKYVDQDLDWLNEAELKPRPELSHLLDELAEKGHLPQRDTGCLIQMLTQPEELRAELVFLFTRLWDRHLESEYRLCEPIERRSVQYFEGQHIVGTPEQIFTEISGRDYPEEHVPPTAEVHHMVFVPSCHCGPYVSVATLPGDPSTLVVTYNCRPSSSSDPRSVLPIEEVFPPLKGLADETRLEILSILAGREFYAQQIVDRMEISQSAVSRHLRLLVACEILQERRHEGMKFYTLNDATLASLIQHLDTLRPNQE